MSLSYAVIGAGFGDEGKGLMTDFLTRHYFQDTGTLNVRFNGGAQAGHTVVDGVRRHVFGHLGAGTFAGAETYLSEQFIANPFALDAELNNLDRENGSVLINPKAKVTTIFDIVLNMFRELSRGLDRHGSCGMGINETVTRHLAGYELAVGELMDNRTLENALLRIYRGWFLPKLQEIDLSKIPDDSFKKYMAFAQLDDEIASLKGARRLFRFPHYSLDPVTKYAANGAIFEGAQGLMLDEELGQFPYVTRSITGMIGACQAATEVAAFDIQPVYVTRCYRTRHGAGPLTDEGIDLKAACNSDFTDKTNYDGKWQGSFRLAPLDMNELRYFIHADHARAAQHLSKSMIRMRQPVIAITHLDKLVGEDRLPIRDFNRRITYFTRDEIIDTINKIFPVKYLVAGETAQDVSVL